MRFKDEVNITLIFFAENQPRLNGQTTAYVCENYNCKFPTTNLKKLEDLLAQKTGKIEDVGVALKKEFDKSNRHAFWIGITLFIVILCVLFLFVL